MSHPLASKVPQVSCLVHEHDEYMSRLSEDERNRSLHLSSQLNVSMLLTIASGAIGSECHHMHKIYEG
jgi:hypothetical protein